MFSDSSRISCGCFVRLQQCKTGEPSFEARILGVRHGRYRKRADSACADPHEGPDRTADEYADTDQYADSDEHADTVSESHSDPGAG